MQFKSTVKLSHINSRRELEGENDDGPLAYDLKVMGDLPLKALKGVFLSEASFQAILSHYYAENGSLMVHDVEKIQLSSEGRACKATIDWGLGNLEFTGAVFGKFVLTPADGRVVSFSGRLQVHPKDDQIVPLNRMLKKEIALTINGDTALSTEANENQNQLPLGGPKEEPETSEAPDELYADAMNFVLESRSASIFGLQRQFKIGYNRAARLRETLSAQGIIGEKDGTFVVLLDDPSASKGSIPGVPLTASGKIPPSTAHGEIEVPGQRPPQKPRKAPPKASTPKGGATLQ